MPCTRHFPDSHCCFMCGIHDIPTALKGGMKSKRAQVAGPRRHMTAQHPDGRPLGLLLQVCVRAWVLRTAVCVSACGWAGCVSVSCATGFVTRTRAGAAQVALKDGASSSRLMALVRPQPGTRANVAHTHQGTHARADAMPPRLGRNHSCPGTATAFATAVCKRSARRSTKHAQRLTDSVLRWLRANGATPPHLAPRT